MIFDTLKTYAIAILSTIAVFLLVLLLLASWYAYSIRKELSKTKEQLAIIENASHQQEAKIVETQKVIEVVKWKTQKQIERIYEYVPDNNKSDCDNGIELLRSQF